MLLPALNPNHLRAEHLWLERLSAKMRNDVPKHFKDLFNMLPDWHKFYVGNSLPIAILYHRKSRVVVLNDNGDRPRFEAAGYNPVRLPLSLWNNPKRAKVLLDLAVHKALAKI
jgi:hypothetical protein